MDDDAAGEGSADGGEAATDDDASESADHEAYEVFVQWRRGKPHEHAETIDASDPEMALLLAKRNVDVRSEPVNIMVAPRSELRQTSPDDTTLVPSTDRSYREVAWYAADENEGEY